jgi:hypothetical protein
MWELDPDAPIYTKKLVRRDKDRATVESVQSYTDSQEFFERRLRQQIPGVFIDNAVTPNPQPYYRKPWESL